MLAGARLGDDALFAHAPGQQDLAKGVVNLVCAGVEEVFPFQVNFGAAQFAGQTFREIKRSGPASEIAQQGGQFFLESRILPGAFILGGQVMERRHQCLGHKHAAVGAEVAGSVGRGC